MRRFYLTYNESSRLQQPVAEIVRKVDLTIDQSQFLKCFFDLSKGFLQLSVFVILDESLLMFWEKAEKVTFPNLRAISERVIFLFR